MIFDSLLLDIIGKEPFGSFA